MKQMELVLEDEIMTAAEVATRLGVDANTIGGWCNLGYFPNAYRVNPKKRKSRWRIPKRDVDAFIEERRKQRGFFRMPVQAVSSN
jgi:predicted site-specific integrase-resolvase